jgi:nucleoside-diphosphate-sugar epimerase
VDPQLAFVHADARDPATWLHVLDGAGPTDVVVHLASIVGVARVLGDPERCYRDNVDGCSALARVLTDRPPGERPAILFASSSEVYASSDGLLAEMSLVRSYGMFVRPL